MKSSLYIVLYLLSNVFRTFNVYLFYETFFPEGAKKRQKWISYSIFYLVISLEYVLLDIPILTLFLNVAGLLALAFLYPSSIKKRVLGAGFILSLLLAVEAVVVSLAGYLSFDVAKKGFYRSCLGIVCIPVISFLLLVLYRKIKKDRKDAAVPVSYWIMVVSVPISSIYMIGMAFTLGTNKSWQLISIVVIMFIITLSVFLLYEKQIEFFHRENRKNLLEAQNAYYYKQINVLQEMETVTKSVRHDLKNHLLIIAELSNRNNYKEVSDYVNGIQQFMLSANQYITTGKVVLDGILNNKLYEAKERGLTLDMQVMIPERLAIDDVDCTILFGNLLDNAIENAKDKITLIIKYDRGRFFLHCENAFAGKRKRKGELYETSKRGMGNHGIGLHNIRLVVKKYDGTMEVSSENHIFKTDIIMYVQDRDEYKKEA